MGEGTSGAADTGTLILALVAYLGAMTMAGLMTAFFRVSGLYRNGLLAAERLGTVLDGYLQASRRFLVTVSTLYLALTVLGCLAWGRLLDGLWSGPASFRFYLVYAVTTIVAWAVGGVLLKAVASAAALGYARVVGGLLFPIQWLLRPWVAVTLWIMDRFDDTLWTTEALLHLSSGEIRSLINEDQEEVTLDEEEREMIHGIFELRQTVVREIMVPRIDMVSLDVSTSIADVVQTVNDKRHSRIPVYEGSIDKVIGVLYSKDLLNLVDQDRLVTDGRLLADLARPAYFIPESKKIDEVLDEFRAQRIHMAVVIDEYGGTAGLVTLEDVIEEIVGEIEDEFDDQEQLFEWIDERTLRVDPKIDLEDLEELLGVSVPAEGSETSETLGGLIYEAAGNVPQRGDRIEVSEFEVTVEEVVDQRILRATIHSSTPLPGFARRDTNERRTGESAGQDPNRQ